MAAPEAPLIYVGVARQCSAFRFMKQTGGMKNHGGAGSSCLLRRRGSPVPRLPLHETDGNKAEDISLEWWDHIDDFVTGGFLGADVKRIE